MARIIRLHVNGHDETQKLLPWYVTGQLDGTDRVRVEAHLRECLECQGELAPERRLEAAVAGLPMDVEQGWAEMRRRLESQERLGGRAARLWRAMTGQDGLRWAVAAQFALIVGLVALAAPLARPARYHALGSAPPAPTGNVIVVFRPDASERDLRQTLRASHARIVDGPTSADAYVLQVPAAERTSALTGLRAQSDVVLAEPIDASGPPR